MSVLSVSQVAAFSSPSSCTGIRFLSTGHAIKHPHYRACNSVFIRHLRLNDPLSTTCLDHASDNSAFGVAVRGPNAVARRNALAAGLLEVFKLVKRSFGDTVSASTVPGLVPGLVRVALEAEGDSEGGEEQQGDLVAVLLMSERERELY